VENEIEESVETAKQHPVRNWLLALVVLHILISFRFPWDEEIMYTMPLRLSSDLVLLYGIGILLCFICRSSRIPAVIITAGILAAVIFRGALTMMPAFYGKPLNIYNDTLMLPGLVHLLLLHQSTAASVVWVVTGVLLTALSIYGLFRLTSFTFGNLPKESPGRIGWVPGLVLILFGAVLVTPRGVFWHNKVQQSVLTLLPNELTKSVFEWREHASYEKSLPEISEELKDKSHGLDLLGDSDVYLLFLESYGRLLYRDSTAKAQLELLAADLEQKLSTAGFYSCSSFATSAVYGGNSSLAHAQFLSGTGVRSKHHHATLLASDVVALPHHFNAAGYRTINAQPAMTEAWPEGKFFGFTEDVFYEDFEYTGHTYHWGFMPDQYALAHLLENEIRKSTQPLFLQYVSVTSHAPFSMIPPYFDDWSVALEDQTFNRYPEKTYPIDWLHYAGHPDAEAAYIDSIHYTLKTMVDFTTQLERPSMVIIIGDHQPPGIGKLSDNDYSYEVPIHILSNRVELLTGFGRTGFQEGLIPSDDLAPFDLSVFAPSFVAGFSSQTPPPESDQ
jgi:hypothetical protein